MKKHKGFRIVAMILIAAGILSLAALVVMLLWNWLIPSIFSAGPTISYWQALGLMVLSKILFGGIKPPAAISRHRDDYWKEKMKEKWDCMDPEKKKNFFHQMHARFHGMNQDETESETDIKE